MSTHRTETSERKERGDETDAASRAKRVASTVTRQGRNGTAAVLTGGALLVRAVRAPRSKRKTAVQGLVGAALFGLGLRQRRSGGGTPTGGDGTAERDGEGKEVSDEAHANRMASSDLSQTETNPRGVAGEPEVETETDPDEGDVQFETEHDDEAERRPQLEQSDTEDPRLADEENSGIDDDHVEVSLSETEMTDELGKVAGPEDEQAYPAREGTDPEPMSDEAPQRYGEGAVANPDAEDRQADDDAAGAEDTTDGNEATGDSEDREDEDENAA